MKAFTPPAALFESLTSGDADASSFALYLAVFVSLALTLQSHSQGTLALFAQRVAVVTQDRFRLLLHRATPTLTTLSGRQCAPVEWQTIRYGSLHAIMSSPSHPHPILPLPLLERLAQTCGWLLQGLETDQYVQAHHAPLPTHAPHLDDLRPQERAVLKLMVRGYALTDICVELALQRRTVEHYQQHLYHTLGVTNAHDAMYFGMRMGILQDI